MKTLLACDPGTLNSAFIWLVDGKISETQYMPNTVAVNWLRTFHGDFVFEMVASYGMAVGRETFETVLWCGRFADAAATLGRKYPHSPHTVRKVYRKDIKMHLCNSMRAKDANIRQALIDKLGPVGTKNKRGPCYGISGHLWAALAVATYAWECPDGGERL